MTTIKKEAAKDVATFATISEVSKSLTDTKAVLNQVVADLYVSASSIGKNKGSLEPSCC